MDCTNYITMYEAHLKNANAAVAKLEQLLEQAKASRELTRQELQTANSMDARVADKLWTEIETQAHDFCALSSHHSDLFTLLAVILAYYQVRGTTPIEMVSGSIDKQIAHFITQVKG